MVGVLASVPIFHVRMMLGLLGSGWLWRSSIIAGGHVLIVIARVGFCCSSLIFLEILLSVFEENLDRVLSYLLVIFGLRIQEFSKCLVS